MPDGLKVTAMATGLDHPRSVYTLPNGDVLVVESRSPGLDPVSRPKNIVMRWVESLVTSAGSSKGSNRITLLRDTHGDGKYDLRTVFIDHLYSPFGVSLVGNDLYVANTDAVLRFPYTPGATSITEPGTMLTPLPGGPIDHHWTKSLVASEDGTKLYAGVGSNSVSGAPPPWPRRVDGQLAFAVAHVQGNSSSMRACGQPWTKRVSRSAK